MKRHPVKNWHYVTDETRQGPVEKQEMNDLVAQGVIMADTPVWKEGMQNWEPARDHFTFSDHSEGHDMNTLYHDAPARDFSNAVSTCLSKYVTFSGRASRSEYWFFFLFSFIAGIAAGMVDMALVTVDLAMFSMEPDLAADLAPASSLASLALFLPSLAVMFRRLHDIDRTGWWAGVSIPAFWFGLPFAGILVLFAFDTRAPAIMGWLTTLFIIGILVYLLTMLIFLCQRGDSGKNRFG